MTAMDKHEQAYTYCAYCPKLCRFSCPVSEATHTESHSTWGKMTAAHLVSTEKRALDESTAKALHACTAAVAARASASTRTWSALRSSLPAKRL